MKLLWHSNAPWAPTGYGQQTKLFTPRMQAAGHDVAISTLYGMQGTTTTWEGMTVYPIGYDQYSNDVLPAWALDHIGDPNHGWIIVLFDVWTVRAERLRDFHMAAWTPVDHDPVPPMVLEYFKALRGLPIAMSRFGQDALGKFDIEALYVPHGFDPVFEPKDKSTARAAIGLPEDAFVVGMNAANKAARGSVHRKNFDGAFQAFKRFAATHDDALLYIHSDAQGSIGEDLENLAAFFGISDRVVFADQFRYRLGLPTEVMPHLYSAFDVFFNPALGEGFGVPIIEAQACGVPVITTDFTAMPEITGAGWAVDGDLLWHDAQQSMWKRPFVGGLVDALEEAYVAGDLSADAVEFAAPYRADRVWEEYWLPVLANLEERIYPAPVEVAA